MILPELILSFSALILAILSMIALHQEHVKQKQTVSQKDIFHLDLADIIKNISVGIIITDINNNIVIHNDIVNSFFGISARDKNPEIFLTEKLRNLYVFEKLNQDKTSRYDLDLEDKSLNLTTTPIFNDNTRLGTITILQDMTSIKAHEKRREDFTNMMVHELRAPATAIKDSSSLILDKPQDFNQEEIKKLIDIINRESNKLLDQIRSILDAAKIERGIFVIEKTPSDLKKIIEESIQASAAQAQEKNITIKKDLPQYIPVINMDKERIAEVIDNLLSNSLKFTPNGGTITVSVKQERYIAEYNKPYDNSDDFSGKKKKEYMRICIEDTGIGVPKDQQEKLFSKFPNIKHASDQNSSSVDSTGLGLYIAKSIVQAHAGFIKFNSTPNKGTSISFFIPL